MYEAAATGTLPTTDRGEARRFLPLLEGLRDFVRELEPGDYASRDVPSMLCQLAEAEKLCGAAKMIMSRRADELTVQNPRGDTDPSQFVAVESGAPVGRARRDLDTARRLHDQPELEDALRRGAISPEQAALISPAITADPDAAVDLIERAEHGSFRDLRDSCSAVIAASLSEQEAIDREARLRERRQLRIGTTEEGAVYLRGELPPVEGALVKSVLKAEADRVFKEARSEGRREAPAAYLADGLVRLCAAANEPARTGGAVTAPAPQPRTPRAEIVLHVSAEALRRGAMEQGDICEIEGVGPVCLSTVEYLFGNAWAKLVIKNGVDILSVTHLGRYIPAHIDSALRARDRVCAVPRCSVTYGLERDHVVPVEDGGPTELDNLVRLCRRHHYLKTHKFWRLSGRPGNWEWVNIRTEQPLGSSDGCDLAPPDEPTVGLSRPVFPLPCLAGTEPIDGGGEERSPSEAAGAGEALGTDGPTSGHDGPAPAEDPEDGPVYRQQTFGYVRVRRTTRTSVTRPAGRRSSKRAS